MLTLIEQAERTFDQQQAEDMAGKLVSGDGFTLEDFVEQLQMVRKLGPIGNLLGMLPGAAQNREALSQVSDKDLDRAEAIVNSMTPTERRNPKIINGSRRARIASGSGVTVSEVNSLVTKFFEGQKMMRQVLGGGGIPGMPPIPGMRRAATKAAKGKKGKKKPKGGQAGRQPGPLRGQLGPFRGQRSWSGRPRGGRPRYRRPRRRRPRGGRAGGPAARPGRAGRWLSRRRVRRGTGAAGQHLVLGSAARAEAALRPWRGPLPAGKRARGLQAPWPVQVQARQQALTRDAARLPLTARVAPPGSVPPMRWSARLPPTARVAPPGSVPPMRCCARLPPTARVAPPGSVPPMRCCARLPPTARGAPPGSLPPPAALSPLCLRRASSAPVRGPAG